MQLPSHRNVQFKIFSARVDPHGLPYHPPPPSDFHPSSRSHSRLNLCICFHLSFHYLGPKINRAPYRASSNMTLFPTDLNDFKSQTIPLTCCIFFWPNCSEIKDLSPIQASIIPKMFHKRAAVLGINSQTCLRARSLCISV